MKINKELENILNRFKLNKLSLNVKKNYIMFKNRNKLISLDNLLIKIDEITNEQPNHANSTTFLGVIINSTLSSVILFYV